MPNHNAKAMRKQANWQAKHAPVKVKRIVKQAAIAPRDPANDYRAYKAAYDRSRSAYEHWAMKGNETEIDHKFRIALGPGGLHTTSPLLKAKFIERYEKRRIAFKKVEALERLKKVCGPGIPDTLGEHYHFGANRFDRFIPIHIRNHVWIDYIQEYYHELDSSYVPYLSYHQKNPADVTDAEFDAELTADVESNARQVFNSFPPNVRRTIDRIIKIKGPLEVEWRRRNCIRTCLKYKEDLMAATWHPRRVQKILDIGGFDLLDRLV